VDEREARGDGSTIREPYRRAGADGTKLPAADTGSEKGQLSSLCAGSATPADNQSYADPLRKFARDDMSRIIPLYEAKTLFCNIDVIVSAAALFLADLEAMFSTGAGPATVGDVCIRHVSPSLQQMEFC